MKKRLFYLALLLSIATFASAQSLSLVWNGEPIIDDTTLVFNTLEYDEIVAHMQVKNSTSETVNVYVMKEEVSVVEDSQNYFCWDQCYDERVFTSEGSIAVAPDSVSSVIQFSGHYLPNNHNGTSDIRYTFYDPTNLDLTVSFIARFIYNGAGLESNENPMIRMYPNPASTMVSFDLNATTDVEITLYNLVGQEVIRQNFAPGDLYSISVADLNEGIYFCSINIEGQNSIVNKLVVKK